jgi:hypothetical protein
MKECEGRAACGVVVGRVVGEYVGVGLAKDDISSATVGCEMNWWAVYGEDSVLRVRGGG